MCWIGYCPPGVTPALKTLMMAVEQNDDGAGWTIRTPNGLEVVRSLDGAYAVSSFLRAREQWPYAHAMFHARYATHGTRDESNVHPFTVPGRDWQMAHNGMLPLSDGPFGAGRSDSRILAEDILSDLSWQDVIKERDTLEQWLGGDKVVIMTAQRQRKTGPVIILNESNGKWHDDGVWHSSSLWGSYKGYQGGHGVKVADVIRADTDADEAWWESQLESKAIESALADEDRREYEELLDAYDRGALSPDGWDRLDELEEQISNGGLPVDAPTTKMASRYNQEVAQ